MAIISRETFEKFTEEEKKKVRKLYDTPLKTEAYNWYPGRFVELEVLFDKENLQPEPKIKTWKDLEKEHPEHFSRSNTPNPMLIPSQELRDKLLKKTMATYKIATLIKFGYGGIVTEEEWKANGSNEGFYCIWANAQGEIECTLVYDSLEFIAFHSQQQAEDFMSYPENVDLIRQYYMI